LIGEPQPPPFLIGNETDDSNVPLMQSKNLAEALRTVIGAHNPQCGAYLRAAKAPQKLGYTDIKHMSASISGWKARGMKTESGK
jgi:hypothetical protein